MNEDYSTTAGTADLCEVARDINNDVVALLHKIDGAKHQVVLLYVITYVDQDFNVYVCT